MKSTVLKGPINGGVNRENGNMVLLFEEVSGVQHRLELPFDQSGPTVEILDRAAKAAAEWDDAQRSQSLGQLQRVNIQPREDELMMLGEDPSSGRPILIVRLSEGGQFSFLLDRQIVEQLRNRPRSRRIGRKDVGSPFETVADDIEWLRDEWCVLYEPPSDSDLRRGSAALRRLLVDNVVQRAWLHHGFRRQPMVKGPDVEAIAADRGFQLRHAASLIAGGACLNGIEAGMIGAIRVFNPKTGKGPDDDEGFAVEVSCVIRDARGPGEPNHLHELFNRSWHLSEYLDAPGAVRRGFAVTRRDIVTYFANYAGGVHLDRGKKSSKKKTKIYQLIEELEHKVRADTMDGLYFELLSIGQAIGHSADLQQLATKIRADTADNSAPL